MEVEIAIELHARQDLIQRRGALPVVTMRRCVVRLGGIDGCLPAAKSNLANRDGLALVVQQLVGVNFLNQPRDARLGLASYLAVIWLYFSGQNLHQRRFASTIAAQ